MFTVIITIGQTMWLHFRAQLALWHMDPTEREQLLAETGNSYDGLPVE